MANHLKMDKVFSILTLHKAGWSNREIASELGIHRETVGRHIRLAEAGSKPATDAPTGSDAPLGSGEESRPASDAPTGSNNPKPASNAPIGANNPKPATDAPIGSADIGQARAPMSGGFIALLPTANGDKVLSAVAKGTALLGSNRSVAAVP